MSHEWHHELSTWGHIMSHEQVNISLFFPVCGSLRGHMVRHAPRTGIMSHEWHHKPRIIRHELKSWATGDIISSLCEDTSRATDRCIAHFSWKSVAHPEDTSCATDFSRTVTVTISSICSCKLLICVQSDWNASFPVEKWLISVGFFAKKIDWNKSCFSWKSKFVPPPFSPWQHPSS